MTHKAQAKEIISYDPDTMNIVYTFNSHEKKGKCLFNERRPGKSLGHSYIRKESSAPDLDTSYTFISTEQRLLPEGRYSWWGIDEEKPQDSIYGACKFSFSFQHMLYQFRLAHVIEDNKEPVLYFKKAGTLRYRREICYVVLICSNADRNNLEHLPPLRENIRHVSLNGMLDDNGIWNGHRLDSHFVYNKRDHEERNWEHLVFGFFFGPNSKVNQLVLRRKPYDRVPHMLCISRIPFRGQWRCPDEVLEVSRQSTRGAPTKYQRCPDEVPDVSRQSTKNNINVHVDHSYTLFIVVISLIVLLAVAWSILKMSTAVQYL